MELLWLRIPTRRTVAAHVTGRRGCPECGLLAASLSLWGWPGHASATRGRCCSKLAGVPRPSAAGFPPQTGWQGNGHPGGPHHELRDRSSNALLAGPQEPKPRVDAMGGAKAGPVQSAGQTPLSCLRSPIPAIIPKSPSRSAPAAGVRRPVYPLGRSLEEQE